MKPDSTATAQRRSEYTARRSRDETVWSLLIVALVVLVIWSGWRSRAPEGTAAIDSQASLESESAPVDEPTDDAPPAPDAASSAVEPDPGFVRDVPEVSAAYRAPEIHVAFKHLYSLYNLPSQGWIRSPLITPEWLESFDHFCKIVARRDPADCAVQRILLLRMSSAPGGALDPWITQMQEWLGEELEKGLGGVDLHAFQVTCGREGCLLFLATASGADWSRLNENLVELFTNDRWSPMLSLRQEQPPLGGPYPDGTGQWDVVAFERLGPINGAP